MTEVSELKHRLQKIAKVFDINEVLSVRPDKSYIQKYYLTNKIPYSLFHTNSNLIHMGISRNGRFEKQDLLGQAKMVEEYINKIHAKQVLELATGRGGSSVYLAKKFPHTSFLGIDISKGQLDFAFRQGREVKNFKPIFLDYHDLDQFSSESFGVVFVIEALCMSSRKEEVINQVYRILKKPGYFIVFDGYRNKAPNQLSNNEKLALKLMEKGMAVTEFQTYNSFQALAKKTKFLIDFEEDASTFVLPTLQRFERLAQLFFANISLARALAKFLPKELIYNVNSGFLAPILVRLGFARYFITVLKKKQD